MLKRLAPICVLTLFLSTNSFAQDAPVTECDRYAASDQGPQHIGVGVPFDKMNPALAIPLVKLRCANIRIAVGSLINLVAPITKRIILTQLYLNFGHLLIRDMQSRKLLSG